MAQSPSYTVRRKSVTFFQPEEVEEFTTDNMDNGQEADVAADFVADDCHPFVEDEFTDVALLVDGESLFTNRSLLAFASPVFSCMFTAEFKEKSEKVCF